MWLTDRRFGLWRPHGQHPARIAFGPYRGAVGVVKQIRTKNRWTGHVTILVSRDPDQYVEVRAWQLTGIRNSDRDQVPTRSAPERNPTTAPLFDPENPQERPAQDPPKPLFHTN